MTYQQWLEALSPAARAMHAAPEPVHQAVPGGLLADVADMIQNPTRPEREAMFGGLGNFARKTSQGQPTSYLENLFAGMDMLPPGIDDALSAGLLGMASRYKFGIPRQNITVMDPQRAAFPGIYENPKEIAAAAARNVAEENRAMKELFGVTRDDLYQMHRGKSGTEAPDLPGATKKPSGSAAAKKVKNPKNTQRIVDVLAEAGNYPELHRGMDAWYEMQPLYDRLAQISDNPVEDFKRFQAMTGMASPGSDVLTEINRGTAALHLTNQGRFDDFLRYGGKEGQIPGTPAVMGHPYHSTAQGKPMESYLETGLLGMKSPKVPLYIQSAGVPQTGFQTQWPVGDAHWSRGVGLADVRTNKNPGASVSMPELQSLGPWWEGKVAGPLGINSVDAQARAWGTFAPATGVGTPVGAPKLELISQKIMDASKAYGISPEQARDLLLQGKIFAPNLNLLGESRLAL